MLLLIVYLVLCTGAIRSGHYRDALQAQCWQTKDEMDVLQAEVRQLQSPARIFAEGGKIGMERPTDVVFTPAPVARRYASTEPTTR
ncbi:MAG: hypothetical protein HY320_07105 [Armatimonadetes bacterium]|nr:hypothetical protein [Armatimonadota bacterium]